LVEDAFQRAAFKVFSVKRNSNNSSVRRMAEVLMPASAVIEKKTCTLQSPNDFNGLAKQVGGA
jgi:hypothetical protein